MKRYNNSMQVLKPRRPPAIMLSSSASIRKTSLLPAPTPPGDQIQTFRTSQADRHGDPSNSRCDGVRRRRRPLRPSLLAYCASWCLVWIAGSVQSPTPPFVFGAPIATGINGENARISSLNFVISGAENRLEGLTVMSVAAAGHSSGAGDSRKDGSNANDEGGDVGGVSETALAVVDGSDPATGVHNGDKIFAVNGVLLSATSLNEWIEASISRLATPEAPGSSLPATGGSSVAIFPLVDINGDAHRTASASPSSPFFTSTLNRCVAVDPKDPGTCSTSSAAKPSQAREGYAADSSGFPLTGFLKVEVIGLAGAEVTFRPGDARLAALLEEKEEAAEVERKERGRLAAEANANLEAARKEKEEEDRKAEAAARAEEAEMARERAEAGRVAEEKRQEEARVRREEEAAAKAVAKSKKDVARMRKEGKQFTFTAEYKEVAPMGLTFDLANPLAVVSEVVAGGLSHAAGVQVRDHLVQVNERDTSEMKPTMAIKLLQRAVWPRVLTFSTPEIVAVEGGNEPLLLDLVVTDPEIARGSYIMQAPKDWGGLGEGSPAAESWSCDPRPMALADPLSGCQQDLRLSAADKVSQGEPTIVLVKRGVCTFVEKAKNVQLAIFGSPTSQRDRNAGATPHRDTISAVDGTVTITTAAGAAAGISESGEGSEGDGSGGGGGIAFGGGMVLLNGEDALADMPAGNLVTDDVRISVAM